MYRDENKMILKKITRVYSTGNNSFQAWVVDYTDQDGMTRNYVFPSSALTFRAAEYGIDLSDAATLLDIIIHEHYMDPTEFHPDHPEFVYNTDQETARSAHLNRVRKLKLQIVHEDPGDLLKVIREAHVRDNDRSLHESHRTLVASLRANKIRAMRRTS